MESRGCDRRTRDAQTAPAQAGRPWPKRISGNPSGLPRDIVPLVQEARRIVLSHAPHAIAMLAVLLDDEDPRVRVTAAEGLLDRSGLFP